MNIVFKLCMYNVVLIESQNHLLLSMHLYLVYTHKTFVPFLNSSIIDAISDL